MYNYLDNCSNSRANTCIKSKPSQTGKDAVIRYKTNPLIRFLSRFMII